MKFANPLALFFLLILPVLWYIWYGKSSKLPGHGLWKFLHYRKQRAVFGHSNVDTISRSSQQDLQWIDYILDGLKLLALAFLILALARPQVPGRADPLYKEGIDMMIALDTSGSMWAEDLKPDRMTAAKNVVKEFIYDRKNDRLGLVVFGSTSFTQCPLTLDHDILLDLLSRIKVGMAGEATAIGLAEVTALNRLRRSEAKSKVIILITDGESNSGEIDPIDAAKLANDMNVKIYTIGIGSPEGAPMPVYVPGQGKLYARNPDGSLALTKLNQDALIQIAGLTQGEYFLAKNTGELREVFKKINALEKIKIKDVVHTRFDERYFGFVLFGLCLLILEFVLSNTVLKIWP